MSETSILPGAESATDSGSDGTQPPFESDEGQSEKRRRLILLGAVLGAVLVAVAAYLLLHGGSSSTPTAAVPQGTPNSAAPAPSSPTGNGNKAHGNKPTGGGTTKLPKKVKQSSIRDPFAALVSAPQQSGGNAASTTTVTSGGSTDTTGTSTGTTPVTSPTTGTTTTTGSGKTGNSPHWIQLMGIHNGMATFDVGYKHHKFRRFHVQPPANHSTQGTVFDKIFALIAIHQGQVSLQIGDQAPFQLATGVAHAV
jgi:hypothetical protein